MNTGKLGISSTIVFLGVAAGHRSTADTKHRMSALASPHNKEKPTAHYSYVCVDQGLVGQVKGWDGYCPGRQSGSRTSLPHLHLGLSGSSELDGPPTATARIDTHNHSDKRCLYQPIVTYLLVRTIWNRFLKVWPESVPWARAVPWE